MELIPDENFEYSRLNKEIRTIVRQRTLEIKNLMRLTAENIINIGQKLTEVKEQLGHGNFQDWLRSEFEWSEQTARQFMQVYRWSRTIENKNFVFSQLATSALYLLAAPSTPSQAREEVLDLVSEGEKISYSRVKNIVDRHKNLLDVKPEVINTVDVLVESEKSTEIKSDRLFRLSSADLGCIVRLYQAEELEVITDFTIGATVRIKVGRWQGQTAEIMETLIEEQLRTTSDSPTPQSNLNVCIVDQRDFFDREKLGKISQNLIISYGDICLVIEGDSQTLSAFTEQIKTDPAFAKNIFQQALNKQKLET